MRYVRDLLQQVYIYICNKFNLLYIYTHTHTHTHTRTHTHMQDQSREKLVFIGTCSVTTAPVSIRVLNLDHWQVTVRLRGIGTGISEANKRVPIFPLLPREASKQASSYFRQRNGSKPERLRADSHLSTGADRECFDNCAFL